MAPQRHADNLPPGRKPETPLKPRALSPGSRLSGPGVLFGVPFGDLGWMASLIVGASAGFIAFFAATFFAILAILVYNSFGNHAVDFSLSYRRVGLPIGIVVLVSALTYLAILWTRRQLRRT